MRLELSDGKANKFWEIEMPVAGRSFVTRWGKIGTAGQDKKQSFASAILAKAAYDKLVRDKRKKGYVPAGSAASARVVAARDAKLEAAIRADREDPAAYAVYADWLQTHGNPIGELVMLQQAKRATPAAKKRAQAILAELALPAPDLAELDWRFGLWKSIRLENARDWMSETFDPISELAAPLFTHVACAALEELRIGILRWDHNHDDVPAVLALAGTQAWAADLPRLVLGDISDNVDMAHHVVGDVGGRITKSFPRLRSLKLHSGEQTWRTKKETFGVAGLDLPLLESLVIETCAMSKKRLAAVLAAKLPKLTSLELWFGGEESFDELAPLRPLLAGKVFPHVTSLGLRNAQFTDALCAALPASACVARLVALDLSMGMMTDDGAAALAAGAASFPKLRTLSVDDNFLSPAGIRAVKAAFRGVAVESRAQKAADDSVDGEIFRFVSVHE